MKSHIRRTALFDRSPIAEEHARLIHRYVVDFFRRGREETEGSPDPLRWTPWVDPQTHVVKRRVRPNR